MMENLIRKVLYTGVGIVAATTERLQISIDELVEKGKLSEEEGKKVVDDVVKHTSGTRKEFYEGRLRKIIDTALEKVTIPQNDSNIKLEKRLKSLEVKVGLLAKEVELQKARRKAAEKASKE